MILQKLINKSYYSSIGYISSYEDLDKLEIYIHHNLPILKEFKNLIIVTNYDGDFQKSNKDLWRKYFPDCVLIDLEKNRGHSFGIADQENAIIDYCKENNIDWICKSAHDITLGEAVLNIDIPEDKDFYYLEGVGYGAFDNFQSHQFFNGDYFYPQTNFYFINTSKIDYLYDKDYVDKTYNYIQSLDDYSGSVWDYIQDWTCEDFLKKCVNRNNISKHHLVSPEEFHILLQIIGRYQVVDSSHKNILIEGICHFQNNEDPIMDLKLRKPRWHTEFTKSQKHLNNN